MTMVRPDMQLHIRYVPSGTRGNPAKLPIDFAAASWRLD
jgi:hypothetical protein